MKKLSWMRRLKSFLAGPKLMVLGSLIGATAFSHGGCSGSAGDILYDTVGYVEEFFYDDYYYDDGYYDDCYCDDGGFFFGFDWF